MAESLVVGSKVRDLIKRDNCNTGGDVNEALSKAVEKLVITAVARAKANGRKTVRGADI